MRQIAIRLCAARSGHWTCLLAFLEPDIAAGLVLKCSPTLIGCTLGIDIPKRKPRSFEAS
jgi:hypothetical protein